MLNEQTSSSCCTRIYLFGTLEVLRRTVDGWQVVPKETWGRYGKAGRRILARLLAAPGRRVGQGRLIADLWPDTDSKGNLDNGLTALRAVIGKEFLKTIDAFYEIAGQELVWVDVDACAALLREVENQGGGTPQAVALLREVLIHLERGEYLDGEEGTWCYGLRVKAEDMLRQCRLWLAEGYEHLGKCYQAGEQYQALCVTVPPDEDALYRWMALLYRQGRLHDALKCYRDVKKEVESQGFELSPHLEAAATRLEQLKYTVPRIITSHALPEQAISLWQPRALPERSLAWATLLQEAEAETCEERAGEVLEAEIIATALQWKRPSGPIAVLQQVTYDIIRKHDTMHNTHSSQDNPITRRQALQAIAFLPIQMYGLTHLASAPAIPPPEEALPLCAAGLTACIELRKYEPEGMRAMQKILAAYLPTLEHLARQSSPYQQAAARLAAQGYLLVNTLAGHYGKLDQIEAACCTARFYAQIAHDPNIEVSALAGLAVKFDYEHRDQKSLETYQEALALPRFQDVSPLLQGRIYAGLAATHAYCQQPSQALSFLSQAKEVFPADPQSDPSYPFACTFCNQATLPLWAGLTLKHTNHHAEAIDAFSRFGSLTPVPGLLECNRAEHLNYTASVAVKQRELDMACGYLDAAEDVAWAIRHEQRQTEVRDTLRSLQLLWPDEPKVKTLREKFHSRQ